MNTQKIMEALARKFSPPLPPWQKRRIVFWYDEEKAFNELEVETLVPEGVRVLKLEGNTFEVKKTIEHDDPVSSFLLYAPGKRPPETENWLLDIELYSESFAADFASTVMDELELSDFFLRDAIARHSKFFSKNQRLAAFKNLGLTLLSEEDVERGIVAVLAGARTTSSEEIVRGVLMAGLDEAGNTPYGEIVKSGVGQAFWAVVEDLCGYRKDPPSLRGLFHALVLTSAVEELHLDIQQSSAWSVHLLPAKMRSRAVVFVDHWISHVEHTATYKTHAAQAWNDLELERDADKWGIDAVAGARTFERFDTLVMEAVVRGLLDEENALDRYAEWIARRRRSHWWKKYEQTYEALQAAIGLFRLRREWEARFQENTAKEMADAYATEYHRFDRGYREFTTARRAMDGDFEPLAEKIEDLYTNWFLPRLMDRWTRLVEESMARHWAIPGVKRQRDFFKDRVKDKAGDRGKVFVIVSDGLRYEAAAQLAEELEQETRSEPKLEWMLGSVPSITELGMAALLPNEKIAWTPADRVTVDGLATDGSANRAKILARAFDSSMVVAYRDLMEWSKEVAREKTVGPRVIYIYHNAIDMDGDKVATEEKTFEATARAIEELKRGIAKIANSLNGTHILVTADHGHLFQQTPLHESEKLGIEKTAPIHAGRRDVVAKKGRSLPGAVEISLDWLLGADTNLSVYVPRGNTRFRASGGSRYVHGGASLQEVIVPVLTYSHVRRSYKNVEEPKKVDVELATTDRRITSTPFALTFHQVEKVGGKVLPRRLGIALWTTGDEKKKASSEERLIADVATDRPEDRTKTLIFHMNTGAGNGEYVLRMVDDETGVEYRRLNFQVSLAISPINW